MKRGLKRPTVPAGFTIVETMIVLAITGFLFVAVAVTWSGRQHKNEFAQSAQEIRSQIQQVIGDVQAGYFPSSEKFKCTLSGGAPLLQAGNAKQGTNESCVFLGKVIQFGMAGTDPEQFRTYSITGLRNPIPPTSSSITAAAPRVLATSTLSPDLPDDDSLVAIGKLQYGLTVAAMKVGATDVAAVGFLSRTGTYNVAGNLNSGTQQLDLYALKTTLGRTKLQAANAVNTTLNTASGVIINQPVKICFKSGATDQYALLIIGQSNSDLTVQLNIKDGSNPPCGI